MTGAVVTRTELYMTVEEQNRLDSIVDWVESMDEEEWDNLPEAVQRTLTTLRDICADLLDMIPEEH